LFRARNHLLQSGNLLFFRFTGNRTGIDDSGVGRATIELTIRLSRASGVVAPGEQQAVTISVDQGTAPPSAWSAHVRFDPGASVVTLTGTGGGSTPPPTDPSTSPPTTPTPTGTPTTSPSGSGPDRTLLNRSTYAGVTDTGPVPGETHEQKIARLTAVVAGAKQRAESG